MSQICPHCNYARKSSDTAPDWQCPACEKAYAKGGNSLPPEGFRQYGAAVAPRQGGAGKWLLLLLVLGVAFWFGRPLLEQHSAQAAAAVAASQPEVLLYATDWCGYCKASREFFAANGIRYVEHDIEKSSQALAEHKKLGGNGVPLIVVGGEVVNGYNEGALRQLLGPWIKG